MSSFLYSLGILQNLVNSKRIPFESVLPSGYVTGRGTCWTSEQNRAFDTAFAKKLAKGKNATATEIREAKKNYPCLVSKSEAMIRARFSNIYLKLKKNLEREL